MLKRQILQRLLPVIPVVLLAMTIIFIISRLIPGDPARLIVGEFATEDQVQKVREEYNLDKPIPVQLLLYFGDVFRGDFGRSMHSRRPVLEDLKEFFPATVELALFSIFFIITIGIPLGVVSAVYKDKLPDHIARLFALGGVAAPVFWVGILMQLVFYFHLDILPIGERISNAVGAPSKITGLYTIDSLITGNWSALMSSLYHLILPTTLMTVSSMSSVVRQTRGEMLRVMKEDYVLFHTAYGLENRKVIYKYALRNALTPTVSVLGLVFGLLLSRAFLVEVICAWPGLGRYVAEAALVNDFPSIVGGTLVIAFSYTLINIVVDIVYMLLNPKVRI